MPFYVDTGLNLIDVKDVASGHLLALEKGQNGRSLYSGQSKSDFQAVIRQIRANYGHTRA